MKPKAYLSLPRYNDVQEEGAKRLDAILEEADFEPLSLFSIPRMETVEDEEKERPMGHVLADSLGALIEADLVVVWLDYLYPKGMGVYHIVGMEEQIELPIPPEHYQMMAAGAQVMARAGHNPKAANKLIVTKEDLAAPIEVPQTLRLNLAAAGCVAAKLGGKALNVPDQTVMFEYGFAAAQQKPIITIALKRPIIGMYGDFGCDIFVNTLDKFKTALTVWREHFSPEKDDDNSFTKEMLEEIVGRSGEPTVNE